VQVRPAVLITDGEQRAALAAARSLGRAGFPVYVCSAHARSLAGASRYVRAQAAIPAPLGRPEHFVGAIAALQQRWRIGVVLPIAEPSLLALLPERARFPDVVLPFASDEQFRAISDKARVLDAAESLGIAVPQQYVLQAGADISAIDVDALSFPLVLKPARSVGEAAGQRAKVRVRYAADAAALRGELTRLPPQAFPLLLQQRIVGPGIGIFLLIDRGETIATFSHRRIREKPPSGGVSVYRESIAADPWLVERSRALLDRFDWQGVAMIEYKVDGTTGEPYLMEINGRFWGSLQLAIDAGVDFPRLLVEGALGADVAPVTRYRKGVRSRWWWGDVDHLIARLRRTPAALTLPPDMPSRLSAVRDFLTLWWPGDRSEIFHFSDPGPAFRETVEWFTAR
jgi:predicted ATP-grasp superfamily ATP-dependent carboligase